ncbi:MAG TPA: 50S ribosomal protein L3 [Candidatus Paceibacterota bacterium]|nr:50S ribosomal protein L3 [Candidatus Paceibacterota bacterium]
MKYILGTKQQMTQFYTADGKCVAATVLVAGPITVTAVKNVERDGYVAAQIGFGKQLPQRLNKAQVGALKDLGSFKTLREFRPKNGELDVTVGQTIGADVFSAGDAVTVSATSKGKGFQGGVKRHGFHGGPRSHGQAHSEREVGSIGAGGMQRVMKGLRMPGRMGSDKVTVKGLSILAVDPVNNLLVVSGAVPGRRGTVVEVTGN